MLWFSNHTTLSYDTSRMPFTHLYNDESSSIDDDFDAICDPFAKNATSLQACSYTQINSGACEGGGYFEWTEIVICALEPIPEALYIILSLLWLLQLFILLAVGANGFLTNNIATITQRLKISESLAGITLVAFGNGSPDIFSAIAAAVSDENPNAGLAFGQLLGGGLFVTSIVISTIIMLKPIKVEAGKTLHIFGFYVVALIWLTIILFTSKPMKIWHPVGFLVTYLVYALTFASNEMLPRLKQWRKSKNLVFVKPVNSQISTIKDNAFNGTQVDSIPPVVTIVDAQANRILDSELPCQDTSFKAILIDLKTHIFAFDYEEFKQSNVYSQIFEILKLPCEIMLRLTIPLGTLSWCKFLTIIHIFTAPIALIFAFQLQTTVIFDRGPEIWVYSLILSTVLGLFLILMTSVKKEPKYYKIIACTTGFVLSIGWVYAICAEVINVVQMLGVISHLSPELLGVTILGWSNSIGDLVADISLAKQGYAKMAFCAGFGGPLFNLLMGFGLAFTIAMAQGKRIQIDYDQQKVILLVFMWISILSSLLLLFLQRFYAQKSYAIYLYILYTTCICILALSECNLLKF